ncbi:hypothetical protein [Aliivibrio kagoshimensis]|uniref:hypothetical protein n=1 Tax=Aliivibrio kagoshimensis TaxID=2910230 RepID=UPI003D147CFC
MSYDLMVFEPSVAPKSKEDFIPWYEEQAKWSEDHSYQDHNVASEALQSWFKEMVEFFPAMNGPMASDDFDDPRITDYCIGKNVIYSTFSWSVVEMAHPKMRELAIKYSVGFFDVSATEGEILFPEQSSPVASNKPWWQFW